MTVSSRQRCRPSGCDDEQSYLPTTNTSSGVVPTGKGECTMLAIGVELENSGGTQIPDFL